MQQRQKEECLMHGGVSELQSTWSVLCVFSVIKEIVFNALSPPRWGQLPFTHQSPKSQRGWPRDGGL